MSGPQATPGLCAPWKVDEFSGTIIWGMDNEGHPIRIADIRGWGSLTGNPYGLEDNDAVAVQDKWAALIAAAPELLEALKEIERASTWCMHIECMEPIGRLTDMARAAIARAEGREGV